MHFRTVFRHIVLGFMMLLYVKSFSYIPSYGHQTIRPLIIAGKGRVNKDKAVVTHRCHLESCLMMAPHTLPRFFLSMRNLQASPSIVKRLIQPSCLAFYHDQQAALNLAPTTLEDSSSESSITEEISSNHTTINQRSQETSITLSVSKAPVDRSSSNAVFPPLKTMGKFVLSKSNACYITDNNF